jgi:predicted transport protein
MKKSEARVTQIVVCPPTEPLFSEMATTVQITDEAAGEFVEVSQTGAPGIGKVQITPEDWPALRAAINRLVRQCRGVL